MAQAKAVSEKTFEVRIPSSLLKFGFDKHDIQQRMTEWLIVSLFTEGHISSGKAARLLNITRVEFLDLLNSRGIAYFNFNSEELAEEFSAVDSLAIKKNK